MLAGIYSYRSILLIMPLKIQLLLLVQLACEYRSCHILCTITQHGQSIHVDIVVDKYNGMLSLFYKVYDMCIGIEYLAIVEFTLKPTEIMASRLQNSTFLLTIRFPSFRTSSKMEHVACFFSSFLFITQQCLTFCLFALFAFL